jgi:hypothetical protein
VRPLCAWVGIPADARPTGRTPQHKVALNRNPSIAICHSMGCNVFEYFLRWMEKTEPAWEAWVEKHIWMHVVRPAALSRAGTPNCSA